MSRVAMSRAGAETRARVVQSAKERMRRHGVEATSMLDAIADAGASRGSLYHYFPGGKAQLIEEATAAACAGVRRCVLDDRDHRRR